MTASHDWRLWTCDCRIVVTEPGRLAGAVAIAGDVLADVERAEAGRDRGGPLGCGGGGAHRGLSDVAPSGTG